MAPYISYCGRKLLITSLPNTIKKYEAWKTSLATFLFRKKIPRGVESVELIFPGGRLPKRRFFHKWIASVEWTFISKCVTFNYEAFFRGESFQKRNSTSNNGLIWIEIRFEQTIEQIVIFEYASMQMSIVNLFPYVECQTFSVLKAQSFLGLPVKTYTKLKVLKRHKYTCFFPSLF